jgi:uncharacterized protein GlcG (DUF336 family)
MKPEPGNIDPKVFRSNSDNARSQELKNHVVPAVTRAQKSVGAKIALIAFCAILGAASFARGQSTAEENRKLGSDIIDEASLFDSGAIEAARKELRRIERDTNLTTVIHTVASLKGTPIAEAATIAARKSGIHGIFVLITKNEHKIEILVSNKFREALKEPRQELIRAGFIEGFKRRDFDEGLKHGVAAIAEQMAAVQREGRLPRTTTVDALLGFTSASSGGPSGASPLVDRNRVRLGLAGARAIVAGAEAKALALGLKVNIAVVDDGGHLLAFERMDGARPASGYTAITKATSAATFRQPTGPLAAGATPADPLLNLSLQNAAEASGGKITALKGGVPVVVDDQVIGAVGIGGGTGEQDAQVAGAGTQAFLDQLAQSEQKGKATTAVEKPE